MTSTLTALAHPLDPLRPEELAAAVDAIRTEHDPQGRMRFVTVTLAEPAKHDLLSWREGDSVRRLAEVVALDPSTEGAYESVVDCGSGKIVGWERLPDGVQPAIAVEEYELCERLVRVHPDFRAALLERGIAEHDFDLVTIDPVPPGNFGYEEERG